MRPATFPTPACSGFGSGSGRQKKIDRLAWECVLTEEERRSFRSGSGGDLNPAWICWLMNWPVNWTSLEPLPKGRLGEWKRKTLEGTWWDEDPAELEGEERIPRLVEACPDRKARIKAIGNGQVPLCAAVAEEELG